MNDYRPADACGLQTSLCQKSDHRIAASQLTSGRSPDFWGLAALDPATLKMRRLRRVSGGWLAVAGAIQRDL